MPRGRKKKVLPPLENNLQDTNVVQKSKPLFSLWKSELTLSEFKILDTYLSRIDSHKPEQREVIFEKGKLEELLGVKKINQTDLEKRLTHLQKTTVNIGSGRNVDSITLFERSQATQDEHGIWQVRLTCTPSAMKYIFNVEKLGYLRYQIRCITSIKSLYSYIMFTYLEYNRFRKSWEVSLDELKSILNCTDEYYNEFYRFNQKILQRCQNELHEKTDIRYTYEPVRKGRPVVAIRFELETLAPQLAPETETKNQIPGQLSIFDDEEATAAQEKRDARVKTVGFGFDDPRFDEFTDEELITLRTLAWEQVTSEDVERHFNDLKDRLLCKQFAVSLLIIQKIQKMNVYDKREPIRDRYTYLESMLSPKKDKA